MQKDPHAVHVYVDGSFQGHQGRRAGYAGHVEFPDGPGEEEIVFGGFKESTNNRMELAAVVAALKWIRESRPTTTRVQIFSDSRYVIDNIPRAPYWCADKGRTAYGRPIENADLWNKFLAEWTRAGVRVDFGWVKGKSSPLLRKVDASAKAAAKSGVKVDRGYRPGKVGHSLKKGGTAAQILNVPRKLRRTAAGLPSRHAGYRLAQP
jgi:ribonuclease HI